MPVLEICVSNTVTALSYRAPGGDSRSAGSTCGGSGAAGSASGQVCSGTGVHTEPHRRVSWPCLRCADLAPGLLFNPHARLSFLWKDKVKEAGRDLTYLVVVLIGISITGGLFYAIFKELFSSSSPNKIYGKALDICRSHPEVISVFGEPVKGFGEATRRGRRQHVSFLEYSKDGLKHMRVKFYIRGSEPGRQGTVHLEVKENPDSGEYEFRYIFVEVDSYPGRTIIVEDNRP
ncbi:PREDICTED: mitochondrial import inner membrane translocase subunit Tim21 isoform X2 [Condylura cristata]|uniref:mitochondrial import inner membrane translocase subunit Tim21 isoform X2 n=1 Tax=Condylura cristata TaxID=143302 RepID=UPI0006437A2D|nr:PREDICTED: mitochondrial import inner membrane translocase subunit Tim21 isoform X2 [Condylura cristata]